MLGILYSALACVHKEEQVCPHLQERASATDRDLITAVKGEFYAM